MFARLFLLFLIVPLIELFLFLVIGREIGILPTFAIIFLTGILGAALARSQGLRAISKYQQSIAEGRLPHEAVIDGLHRDLATLPVAPSFIERFVEQAALGFVLFGEITRYEHEAVNACD